GDSLQLRIVDGSQYNSLLWSKDTPVGELEQDLNASLDNDILDGSDFSTSESNDNDSDLVVEEDDVSSGNPPVTLTNNNDETNSQKNNEVVTEIVQREENLPDEDITNDGTPDLELVVEKEASPPIPLTEELEFSEINQKKRIQLALRIIGLYTGKVDGIIGSQSEAAVSLYQRRLGEEQTGTLTLDQRLSLFSDSDEVIGFVDSRMLIDRNLGLKVILPTDLLELSEISYPYVILAPTTFRDINVALISMDGGKDGLRALFEGILKKGEIPRAGYKIKNGSFDISYSDFKKNVVASAKLFEDRIRGVIVTWNPDQDYWMNDYSQIIAGSISEINSKTLVKAENAEPIESSLQILSRNNIQEPKSSASGFYISSNGDILTSLENVDGCNYITADFKHPVEIRRIYEDYDLAHLVPLDAITPISYAELKENQLSYLDRIIMSGYSFGGLVKESSITVGSLSNAFEDSNGKVNYIVEMESTEGDFGGPILDETGAVIGVLTRSAPKGKILPSGIHSIQPSSAILELLKVEGIEPSTSTQTEPLEFQQLNRVARDITVLVRCF
ncbi:MAG: serine protease, partial [Rhodobacteraceae bacterium]|nr:serine protease [Paracoccaceae bacterium]